MPTATDLPRITALLTARGLGSLLTSLAAGDLRSPFVLEFREPKSAQACQRLLYNWLTFHPAAKKRTTLRVAYSTLSVLPKAVPERRGRRPGVQGRPKK